jgi:hypothetical protein
MGQTITDGFSQGDDEKAVAILKKFKGGPISDNLFAVIAGMMPTTGAVVVFVRNRDNLEILFVPRPDDDPTWPGALNLPGKMFRNVDFHRDDKTPINGPLERIQESEIRTKFPKEPEFAGVNLNSDRRGSWAVLVYFIEVDSDFEYKGVGEWIKFSDIKSRDNLVQTEINHVNIVLEKLTV